MNKKSVFFLTFGCQMNTYDSDRTFSLLAEDGYEKTETPESADLLVVNTCAVRAHAEERALARIQELSRNKKKGSRMAVMGCMAQRLGNALREQNSSVDLVIGPDQIPFLPVWLKEPDFPIASLPVPEMDESILPKDPSRVSVYVAIARGCNNHCSYCIVPLVRGPERSRSCAAVLQEVSGALDRGAKEIFLLGQNVNSYQQHGVDFSGLLKKIQEIPGDFRIRFMTSHPKDLSKNLILTLRECSKVCEHFHLPLQAGSDAVLARMNRGYTAAQYLEKVQWLREQIPGLSLTTDLIAGFPGETDADFRKTLAVMKEVQFDDAFTYRYSPRPGTPAEQWPDAVTEEEKSARLDELIVLQKKAKAAKQARLIGKTFCVLFEKPASRNPRQWWGKTRCDRPVVVENPTICAGAEKTVRITGSTGATLIGEIII